MHKDDYFHGGSYFYQYEHNPIMYLIDLYDGYCVCHNYCDEERDIFKGIIIEQLKSLLESNEFTI